MSIWFKVDLFDQQNRGEDHDDTSMEDSWPDTMRIKGPFTSGHIILGAAQKNCSFSKVSAAHRVDPAFSHFKNKFKHFIHADYNSESNTSDLHSILDSTTSVCLQNLIFLNVTTQCVINYMCSYLNTTTWKSLSHQRSHVSLRPTVYTVTQSSTINHDTIMFLLQHQMAVTCLRSLYSCL